MKKYGYVFNLKDTPSDNYWGGDTKIELKDNSLVYGYEGFLGVPEGKGEMFTQKDFLVWLDKNRKQEEWQQI